MVITVREYFILFNFVMTFTLQLKSCEVLPSTEWAQAYICVPGIYITGRTTQWVEMTVSSLRLSFFMGLRSRVGATPCPSAPVLLLSSIIPGI